MNAFFPRSSIAEDVEERFVDLPDMRWETFAWFLAKGVPSPALVHPELPKIARVTFSGGHFDFGDDDGNDGVDAMILLARNAMGEAADLVAWTLSPRRCAAHWGVVSLLGEESIYAVRLDPSGALPVHRTAFGWLKAERSGVVILEPKRAALALFSSGPFATEDNDHARELRGLFGRYVPRVIVPRLAEALR